MTVITEARTDRLWHALGYEIPEVCGEHHCWTNECPPGSHDDTVGEAA
ncbi:hypothetical protein [Streptomyces sp. NPDC001205]